MPDAPMDGAAGQTLGQYSALPQSLPGFQYNGIESHPLPRSPPFTPSTLAKRNPGQNNALSRGSEPSSWHTRSSPDIPSGSSMTTPPHSTHDAHAKSPVLLGYVATDEYLSLMKQNSELSRELEQARNEVEKANAGAALAATAFRKLAEWSYNERQRLLDEVPRPEDEINELDFEWLKHTLEILKGQQQARKVKDSRVSEVRNITVLQKDASDAEEIPSITDQIDLLISEEKAKLMDM